MAFISSSFSNRKLQDRRFTTNQVGDSQEAFASVLSIGSNEVFTDTRYILTSSLPFSGSSQDGLIASASRVDANITPGSADDLAISKYWFQKELTPGATAVSSRNETFFFLTGALDSVSEQTIHSSQVTNFLSPKFGEASIGLAHAENANPGYNVRVYITNNDSQPGDGGTGAVEAANYVFDYKTGVLSFVNNSVAPTTSQYVWISAYQYVGRTLQSQLTDGTLSGGDTVSLHISASEGTGFSLTNNATSSFESGSAGITVTATSATNKITIGASTDNVTFNTVNASTINADIIEASEYIVSSSITYMTQSFSGGSTIFGDSIDDTHLFTGSLKLTGSLIADIATTTSERTPLVIDSNGNITVGDDYVTSGDVGAYDLDISSSGDNNGITITDAEALIISGSGGLDVTSDTNTLTFTIGNGILSSSAQIKDEISGSFTETSASIASDIATNLSSITDLQSDSSSFSTRVTTNETDIAALQTDSGSFSTRITTLEGNEVHTAAAISGSTRIYVSGSDSGFDIGQDSTLNFVSGTAGLTVVSNGSDTITIGASTDDVTFNSVTADTLTGTATKIDLSDVGGGNEQLPLLLSKEPSPNDTIGYRNAGLKLLYNPGLGELQIGDGGIDTTYGTSEIQGGGSLALSRFRFHTDEGAIELLEIGSSTSNVVIGNTLFISGSSISTDETSFSLINDTTTTINFGGAATDITMGAANGTVTIAGSASIAGDLIVQGTTTSIQTENLNVSDQFILLASGSTGTSDGGIIVQSGSNGVGTALYFDANANRWAVNPANTVNWNDTSLTPKQYVVSVSASAAAPLSTPLDFGDSSEYYGMMHVNTGNGDIYIYS